MTHRTATAPARANRIRTALAALLLALASCCLAGTLGLSGCSSDEDQPTAAEQAEYEGKTLYQYNLDRGVMAMNDYNYDNLESFGANKYYLKSKKVVSRTGVDVSELQQDINWSKVRAGGIDFAFIRLGYRGCTEGAINEDANYQKNLKGAKEAGLKTGVYFFSQATSEAEAEEEAQFVVDKLGGIELDYPVVYDLETDAQDDSRAKDLAADQVTANALAFCNVVKEAGYTPMIYLNKNAATHEFDLSQLQEYPFWYAEYNSSPSLGFDFAIWQFSSEGSAFGINGNVDLDILFDESKLALKPSDEDQQ